MTQREIRTVPATLEIRADADKPPVVAGIAAPFDSESRNLGGFTEKIQRGAFKRSLEESEIIHALWNHDTGAPLGSTRSGKLDLRETDAGLEFELDARRMTPQQLDAVADGDMRMSFGFSTKADQWEDRDDDDPLRTLLDVDLFEISMVTQPAYEDTAVAKRSLDEHRQAQLVSAEELELMRQIEESKARR